MNIPAPDTNDDWQLNGTAAYVSTDLRLTSTATSQIGTAIYKGRLPLDGLHLTFQSECSGGGGADGITVLLLDPAQEGVTAIGGGGGACGFDGLAGAAFKIETYASSSDRGVSWQYCATHGGSPTREKYNADTTLGGVAVNWSLTFTKTAPGVYDVVVLKNGSAYVTWTGVHAPDNVWLGFGAATGGITDNHYVRSVSGTADDLAVSDTFNRSNATTLGQTSDGNATWLYASGTWGISSNQAAPMTFGGAAVVAIAEVYCPYADGTVEAVVGGFGSGGAGIAFRIFNGSNFWMVQYDPLTGGRLYRVNSDVYTLMASFALASGDTVAAVLDGASIVIKVNGVTVASLTDTYLQSVTAHGLYSYNDTAHRMDSWQYILPPPPPIEVVAYADAIDVEATAVLTLHSLYTWIDAGGSGGRTNVGQAGVDAHPRPANDDLVNATTITGASGSVDYSVTIATLETDEDPPAGTTIGPAGSVWFFWNPGDRYEATFTTDPSIRVETYIRDAAITGPYDYADLLPAGGGDGGNTFPTDPAEVYLIRAYPINGNDPIDPLTLSWTTASPSIDVTVPNPYTAAPGVLAASVNNEPPGETITFTYDTDLTVRATGVTDDDGNVSYVSVLLPEIPDGVHLLIARSSDGRVGNAAFTVSSTDYFTSAPTPPPPSPGTPSELTKWQFEDPTDGTVWVFPINPASADSVMLPRTFQVTPTTSVRTPTQIVMEGGLRARSWGFKGNLFTTADLDALSAWIKPYRVYLTDDFGRVFIVKLLRVARTPVRDVRRPEHQSYEATALLYGRAAV